MSGPKLKDVPLHRLRKLGAKPMTMWESVDADRVEAPRPTLKSNERWTRVCWKNNRYVLQMSIVDCTQAIGFDVLHIWVRAHDQQMPRSWSDLQGIKNFVAGHESVAVEVFPSESEVVDSANMAHLWCYPRGYVLPFRLHP